MVIEKMKYLINRKINFFYILLIIFNNSVMNKSYASDIDTDALMNKIFSEHSYICIPDQKSGFYYDLSKKSWKADAINTLPKKMLLQWKDNQWHWTEFGKKHDQTCEKIEFPWAYIHKNSDSKKNDSLLNRKNYITLRCTLPFGELIFSHKSLRYIETYTAGYVFGLDNKDSVSSMEIGTCVQL